MNVTMVIIPAFEDDLTCEVGEHACLVDIHLFSATELFKSSRINNAASWWHT